MITDTTSQQVAPWPSISVATAWLALRAGIAGLLVWEAFARGVAPLWLGHPLEPTELISMAFGIESGAAQVIHLLTGVLVFPLGFLLLRAAFRQLSTDLPDWALGLVYGGLLWIFAMFVIASLIGGMPAFMGFGAIAWASLVGHLLMGFAYALASDWLASRGGTV